MKTEQEIKQLAEREYPNIIGKGTDNMLLNAQNYDRREACIKAYTDCQKEMSKTHVQVDKVKEILNTVCHPDHASELIGYIELIK